MKPRVGAIRYLNALPLVDGLDRDPALGEVRFEVPSFLAQDLRSRDLDIALVPQVEACRASDYRIAAGLCIACRGAVESILLFRSTPWSEIETIGVDLSSNSSVELLQVLFHRRLGRLPRCVPITPTLAPLRRRGQGGPRLDAVLLIGDRALANDRGEFERDDLGEIWWHETHLPFVFAVWLGRGDRGAAALPSIRRAARNGLAHRQRLVEHFCREQPGILEPDRALRYVTDVIHYELGAEEIESMRIFHQLRGVAGLTPQVTWEPEFFVEPAGAMAEEFP
ncbi:MAG: menaquinone biosynthetic enzyme MqnA/MqnD family protein [Planctomycetota bacterium]